MPCPWTSTDVSSSTGRPSTPLERDGRSVADAAVEPPAAAAAPGGLEPFPVGPPVTVALTLDDR